MREELNGKVKYFMLALFSSFLKDACGKFYICFHFF